MKKIWILGIVASIFLVSCSSEGAEHQTTPMPSEPTISRAAESVEPTPTESTNGEVMTITAQQAKEVMDSGREIVILDVRTPEEFSEGHIKGAVLLPDYEIEESAKNILPNKDAEILVYCRSGRRSKIAANALVSMGYTNVSDFGGIIDWNYEIVTE